MYHISEESWKAAENVKTLKQQILTELTKVSGLNPEWLATVKVFLDGAGADVVIDSLIKAESGHGFSYTYQEPKTPPLPPVR